MKESLCLAEQFDVAGLAVGVVAVLLERAFVEELEAEGTGEVLRVPLLPHCCYTLASDRLLAGGTEGTTGGMVVDLAVRLSLVVEIVPSRKRHSTHLHNEVTVLWGWGGGGLTITQDSCCDV
jgi:hypothetical protein